MIDFFQDRRVFVNQKRKQFYKNGLPQIKYPLTLVKRNSDLTYNDNKSQIHQNNITSYQPLSNILISKRIGPNIMISQTLTSSSNYNNSNSNNNNNNNNNNNSNIHNSHNNGNNSNNKHKYIQKSTGLRKQSIKRIIMQNFDIRSSNLTNINKLSTLASSTINNPQEQHLILSNNNKNIKNKQELLIINDNVNMNQKVDDINSNSNNSNVNNSNMNNNINNINNINNNIMISHNNNNNYNQFQQLSRVDSLIGGMKKRNSTSLSYRIRIKQKQRLFIQNEYQHFNNNVNINIKTNKESRINQNPNHKPKPDDGLCTFLIPRANNNQDLVREILLSRKIWRQTKPGEQIPNFKWIFNKQRYNYKKMYSYTQKRIINHFQFNQQISTKDNLIKNLQIYCQTKKIQMFTITPITFIIDFDDQWCEYNLKQFLTFFNKHDPRKLNKKVSSSSNNNYMNFVNKFNPYMAWQNSDIKKKINQLSKPINNSCYYNQNSYLWLLKPTGLNRGRGIEIFDSLDTLEKMLISFLEHLNRKKIVQQKEKEKQYNNQKRKQKKQNKQQKKSSPNLLEQTNKSQVKQKQQSQQIITSQSTQPVIIRQNFKLHTCSFVIQKYVQKPFLINNRKFDIRVWALLTHNMQLYFFKQGYIRTSTQVYNTDNIQNYYIHLTNNAIQKNSQHYGQYENGNQLSFWRLKQYMSQQEVEIIWQKIKEITYMAFSSVKKKINYYNRRNCFQIFGLDYFIDHQNKVWLIEVNQNPCIQTSSTLLTQLIPRMLNDAFKLTIDQIIQKKKIQQKIYKVDNYPDHQNMWQLLGQMSPNAEYSPIKKQIKKQ